MIGGGMGIGISTYRVMSLPQYAQFPYKGSELVWKMKGKDLAPNGALMRNSIVCLIEHQDLDKVLKNCENIARLTHHDPRCIDSCKVMAHLVYGELIDNPLSIQEFKSILELYDPRLEEYLLPMEQNVSSLNLEESKALGYTLKALSAGVWAYYFATSFEEGIKRIIMEGGDADTNGCIAGSLLGAKFGFDSIPIKYVEGLNKSDELEDYFNQFLAML